MKHGVMSFTSDGQIRLLRSIKALEPIVSKMGLLLKSLVTVTSADNTDTLVSMSSVKGAAFVVTRTLYML